jgi:hypothetical protein
VAWHLVRSVIHDGLAVMWGEGPGGGHYENMRGPYSQLGCGVFVSGAESRSFKTSADTVSE